MAHSHQHTGCGEQALRRCLHLHRRPGSGGRAGQAMAEFLVGLVCIMLLVAGMLQIAVLSQRGFTAMTNARREMALQYVEPTFNDWLNFNFSEPTVSGADERSFTADDRKTAGDDSFYQDIDGFLNKVDDPRIGDYLDPNPQSDLAYDAGVYSTTHALDMLYAADQQRADVVPFMDKVLERDRILIGRDLWMPRWDRIP